MGRTWSLVAVIVSAACFGTLAVLTPLAYDAGAEPLPLLAWRFLFASVLLGVMTTIRDPRALRVPLSDVGRFSALALTGYGAASVCYFYALTYADASVVAVLLYAYPALVTIASWLFMGERIGAGRWVAVAITFIGCALVVGLGTGQLYAQWQGIALGLGAAVGYTLFNLLSHRWLEGRSRLTMMAYTFGIATLLPAALAFVGGALGVGLKGGVAALSPAGWATEVWWLLGAIVLIPTFAAVVLYLEGIRGLGPSQAAVVSTIEPLFTIVLAWSILGEQLATVQLVGAALVVSGVVASELGARATPPLADI